MYPSEVKYFVVGFLFTIKLKGAGRLYSFNLLGRMGDYIASTC